MPKFTITGDTIDDLALEFAELVLKATPVEVVKTEKGVKFGVWKLDDGSSDSPIYKSMGLTPEVAAKYRTPEGSPLRIAVDVRYLDLTPVSELASTMQARKAATIQRIQKRLGSVETLKAQLARLQS